MTSAFSQLVWHSAGLTVAWLLALTLFRLWRRRPVASYRAARAVVAAALVLPLAAGLLQVLRSTLDGAPTKLAQRVGAPREAAEVGRDPVTRDFEVVPTRRSESPIPVGAPALLRPPLEPSLDSASTHASAELRDLGPLAVALLLPAFAELEESWAANGALTVERSLRDRLPEALRVGATVVWAFGAAFAVTLVGRRLFETRRLLARSRKVADASTQAVWDRVRRGSPLETRAQLLESDELVTPASAGRATVLLPPPNRRPASDGALRCALLHELVHLERRDTRSSLLQQLFVGLFWFHPAAWWLGRRVEELRELSCDELVVQRSGQPKRYAHALLEYASALGERKNPQLVSLLSWASAPTQLTRRIEMLIERRTASNVRARGLTALAATGVFGCLWSGQLAVASVPAILDPSVAAPSAAVVNGVGDEALWKSAPRDFGVRIARPGDALAAMVGGHPDELFVVEEVYAGSVADRAGLEKWDVVTKIDRGPATREELQSALERLAEGKKHVTLRVQRHGKEVKLKVKSSADEARAEGGEDSPKKEKGKERSPRSSADDVRDTFTQWADLLADEDQWATYDWLREAQRFFRGLDGDDMRELLESTQDKLGHAIELGQVPAQYAKYVEQLRGVAGRDMDEYLGGMREYLAHADPKDFRKQFLKSLDGQLKDQRKAKRQDGEDRAERDRGRDRDRDPSDLAAALRDAERRIAEQQTQIAELSKRLDALLDRLER